MADMDNEVYKIPAPIAAALSTGRGLFAKIMAEQVLKDDGSINADAVAEMCRLLGDLIEDNRKIKTKVSRIEDLKESLIDLQYNVDIRADDTKKEIKAIREEIEEAMED